MTEVLNTLNNKISAYMYWLLTSILYINDMYETCDLFSCITKTASLTLVGKEFESHSRFYL